MYADVFCGTNSSSLCPFVVDKRVHDTCSQAIISWQSLNCSPFQGFLVLINSATCRPYGTWKRIVLHSPVGSAYTPAHILRHRTRPSCAAPRLLHPSHPWQRRRWWRKRPEISG